MLDAPSNGLTMALKPPGSSCADLRIDKSADVDAEPARGQEGWYETW